MTLTVELEATIAGNPSSDGQIGTVAVDLPEDQLTVADLIRRAVESQIRMLSVRMDPARVQALLGRQYLTDEEAHRQAATGAVIPVRATRKQPLSLDAEVARALRAFQSGRVLILVGGRQVQHLEDLIHVTPDTRIVFLRLMPLAGGAA